MTQRGFDPERLIIEQVLLMKQTARLIVQQCKEEGANDVAQACEEAMRHIASAAQVLASAAATTREGKN